MNAVKAAIAQKDFSNVPNDKLAECLALIALFVQTDASKGALAEAAKRLKQIGGAA